MDRLMWTMEISDTVTAAQVTMLALLAAAGVFFGLLLTRSRIRTERFLPVTGLVLMISEVFKGFFLYHLYGHYSWSDFPFQLCSIPMYLCVLYYFCRRRWILQFTMVYSLIGAAASFLVPPATLSPYIVLTVHSLFWHTMLLLIGVFLVCRQSPEDMRLIRFLPVGTAYLVLSAAAVGFNSLFYNISGGTMNMFFLGPGWPDMFILNDIYTDSGWIPATLGMIGVSEGAGLGVFLLISLLVRKTAQKKNPSSPLR